MVNTSATGGILLPTGAPPANDVELQDFLQSWIVGITGILSKNVMPRWQKEPPNIPGENVDWLSFGIVRREAETFAAEIHISAGDGSDEIRRHEILHILVSFYGPNADNNLSILREGMQVGQNREPLGLAGMGIVGCEDSTTIPEMIKERWMYRVDLPFSIRRQIVRTYPILNILSSKTTIDNESNITYAISP
jgi:hypothetical protein